MNRLSVCVIAQNEQENLPRLLKSVEGIADEVVVVDSGSTDRTTSRLRWLPMIGFSCWMPTKNSVGN